MKVLLAINDRDLLSSLEELLNVNGIETDSAFDGVQAISLLPSDEFDCAVIDEYITLLPAKKIAETCKNEFHTNVVLLCDKKSGDSFADIEIKYPFVSGEFVSQLRRLSETKPGINENDQGDFHL